MKTGRSVFALGRRHLSVAAEGPRVSVLAKVRRANRSTPADTREAVLDRLEKSFLYERLNTTDKRLVFRPTKARLLESMEPIKKDGQVLQPQSYPGLPSVKDLHTLIETSESAEDLKAIKQYFLDYAKYPHVRGNLRTHHFRDLLRRAAELGEFTPLYHFVSVNRNAFEQFVTQPVYLEALRITALRVSALPHRSKNLMMRFYHRAPTTAARELVLLYAYTKYAEKFGEQYTPGLEPTLVKATELLTGPGAKRPELVDLSIGLAAAELLGERASLLASTLRGMAPETSQQDQVIYEVFLNESEVDGEESVSEPLADVGAEAGTAA